MGLNLPSKKMIFKDLIKVEGRVLTAQEANQLALFAPAASINIVTDYKISQKFTVELPAILERVIVCPNLKCITNNEPMSSRFMTALSGDIVVLTCGYCRKSCTQEEITEYKI